MTSNLETIRNAYAAFARGDVSSVLAMLAPEAVWIEAEGFPYGGTYTGSDAILKNVFMKIGAEWEGFAAVPQEFVVQADAVVALGQYSGTYKMTGKGFSAPFAHAWSFRNGKVVRYQQYTDTAVVRKAMT